MQTRIRDPGNVKVNDMKRIYVEVLVCSVFSASVLGDCQFGDQIIPVDDSISVIDPLYEKAARMRLTSDGYSPLQIEQELKYMDGIVFNLECRRQYKANSQFNPEDATHPGEAFIYIGDVLVASDVYSDSLANVKGLK